MNLIEVVREVDILYNIGDGSLY